MIRKEISEIVGEKFAGEIENIWDGNKEHAKIWFYAPMLRFENKSPYQLCIDGKIDEVKNLVGKITHGVYS